MKIRRATRGAALPMVLFAMTIASALAVGGAFVARQLAAAARFAQRGSMLQPAAERSLVELIAMWDSSARSDQPIGSVTTLASPAISGLEVASWVTRSSDRTYWLVAEAASRERPPVRRRIGVLVRVSAGVPALVPLRAWSDLP